jgi:hypothetical protein
MDWTTMALEPLFTDNVPFFFSRYRVYVTVGTYVMFDNGNGLSVGRILQITGDQVVVNIFVSKKELDHPNVIVAGPMTDESVKHMTELFQTSRRKTIFSSDVTDLSFVFKDTDIISGGATTDTCQGVANAYVIRYRDDGTAIPANECLAFACEYHEFDNSPDFCYPFHVWNCLTRLNIELSRMLGSSRESQALENKSRVKIGMDRMCWRYLMDKSISVGCCGVNQVSLFRFKRITLPGLTIKKRMEIRKSDVIRFETESELVGLAGLIGERALVNVRAKTPFSSERDGRELIENDTINVVVGSDEKEKFSYRTNQGGVDFIFDGLDTAFITVRYSSYQFSGNNPHKTEMAERVILRKRPRCLMEDEEESEEEEDDEITIYLDCEFVHERSLYRVTRITNTQVFAKCIRCANHMDAMRATNNYGVVKCFDDLAYVKEQIKCRL